jgi:hypothetical protein
MDPKWDAYPGWSPYVYALNNPLRYIDPTGEWYIEVQLHPNRYKTGRLILYDKSGQPQLSIEAIGRGTHRDPFQIGGDTPTGKYRFDGGRIDSDNSAWQIHPKNEASYGPNPRLKIGKGISGNAKEASERTLLRIHGGELNSDGSLKGTYGCIRCGNKDMNRLYESVKELEANDPDEHPQKLEVIEKEREHN